MNKDCSYKDKKSKGSKSGKTLMIKPLKVKKKGK